MRFEQEAELLTTETHSRRRPTLLAGMPEGVQPQRQISWSAALGVVTPLIKTNDPQRAHALPVFENWLRDRDQQLSVQQAACYWDNFLSHYVREMPARVSQWLHNPLSKDVKNPVLLARLLFRIWVAMYLMPLKTRMQRTSWGRMGYRVLQGVGYAGVFCILFPVAMVLVGLLTWVLIEIRDPLRAMVGLW